MTISTDAGGARSAPQLTYDFPGFTCISVNDEIVHGIPGSRPLADGDLVKLDEGLVLALEPMLTGIPARAVEEVDSWTLRTDNRTLAVHHEHTIMIRHGAPLVLTAA